MAVVLFEDSADPRDMLNSKLEHDQLHWSLAHLIVLIQIAVCGERDNGRTVCPVNLLLDGGGEL